MADKHPLFLDLQTVSKDMKEHNDCSVKAIAVATGVSYKAAHAALKAEGRRDRGTTRWHLIHKAVLALGYELEKSDSFNGYTLNQLEKRLASSGSHSPMLVGVRGHVLGVKSNKIVDWTAGGRRHRVIGAYYVVKKGGEAKVVEYLVAPKKADLPKETISRPRASSKCGQLWECLDILFGEDTIPLEPWDFYGEYLETCGTLDVSNATARTQFSQWKRWRKQEFGLK